MRIFYVISGFENGGVEALLFRFITALDKDAEVHIVAHGAPVPACMERFLSLGVRVHLIPSRKHPVAHTRALLALFSAHHPDVVHVHTGERAAAPLVAARRAGVPCRIHHTHTAKRYEKNPIKALLYRFNLWRGKRAATGLVACSREAARYSFGKKALAGGEVTVLKNGIDTGAFAFDGATRAATRAALGISPDTILVLMVARFARQKNHAAALRVFAAYQKKNPTAVLLLVGDGPLRAGIERRAARLPAGSVRFLGAREDVAALLAAADRYLLPSRFEGLPLTLLEAEAAGLLPVASDRVSREASAIGATRFLPLGRTAKWVAALDAAAPQAREAAHRAVALAGFDEREMLAAFLALYRDFR